MKTNRLIILFLFAIIIISCKKYDDYSPIPVVEYDSSELLKDLIFGTDYLNISIKFIDGDGDICFYETDTVKNIIFTLFYLENDSLKPVELAVPYEYKIPYYEPEGRNKLMQGSVKTKFYIDDFKALGYDTLKLNFYVFDRAYNKSNIGATPLIIMNDY